MYMTKIRIILLGFRLNSNLGGRSEIGVSLDSAHPSGATAIRADRSWICGTAFVAGLGGGTAKVAELHGRDVGRQNNCESDLLAELRAFGVAIE